MLDYQIVYDWVHSYKEKSYCENRDFRNRRCGKCGPCKGANKEFNVTMRDMNSTADKIALEDHSKTFDNLDKDTQFEVLAEAGTYALSRLQQRMEKRIAEAEAAANAPNWIESLYEVYTEGLQHEAHRKIVNFFGKD